MSYFFLRFDGLRLDGSLIPSSTTSRASCSNSERFSFGGNASGWPRLHSVVFDRFLRFPAMRPLSHVHDTVWRIILRSPDRLCVSFAHFSDDFLQAFKLSPALLRGVIK